MRKLPLNEVICGDSLETLKTFPDKSVDCVITSPPYWQLRMYSGIPDYVWGGDGSCDHVFLNQTYKRNNDKTAGQKQQTNKGSVDRDNPVYSGTCLKCGAWKGQLGLEPTFELFLEHLWMIMDEIWRVLKDDGTVWINLGDTYMNNSSYSEKGRQGLGNDKIGMIYKSDETVKQKSLCLIPHRFGIGCIDRGWIVRNDIIWAKRNGMPESVTDRFSKKHEYFFFMVKQQKYYFDLDAVRDKHKTNSIERWSNGGEVAKNTKIPAEDCETYGSPRARYKRITGVGNLRNASNPLNDKGKNPGDVSDFWDVPTKPSKAKHYATFNTQLVDKPIIAGCPEGGIVLDPFAGTGTTLARAIELKRNAVGIDGSKEYCEIAQEKLAEVQSQIKLAI